MDKLEYRSARAADIAALDTRSKKDTSIDGATMRDVWQVKAEEIDFDPGSLTAVLDRTDVRPLTDEQRAELFARLVGPEGLTARASTFDRRAVLEAIAEALPTGDTITDIDAEADRFLTSREFVRILDPVAEVGLTTKDVIRLADGTIVATPSTGRWSTRQLVEIEQHLVDQALARRGDGTAIVHEDIVQQVLALRASLTAEQALMVARLVTDGNGVDVVSAAAGTGKTFTLDAARHAWEAAGYRVIGAAHTGQAARELHASAAINSYTLAMLQIDLDAQRTRLDDRTILLIDEAGMAGTRTLAPILDAAHAAGAKVVLVGDSRQLPEIDAGGVLAGLTGRLDPIELIENRRQHHAWEVAALDHLREGNVDTALDEYQRHGGVITAATAIDLRDQMVADWWSWRVAGDKAVMIVLRNSDADDLNGRARDYQRRAHRVRGPELVIDDRPYQAGDEILCRRNDYRLDVRNGTRGTITHVDADTRSLTIRTDDDRMVRLPTEYLDAGYIAHGYASTVWKTQGATYDRSLILGTDELYRERGYVAFSRGQRSNHLYMIGGTEPDLSTSHGPAPLRAEPVDLVAGALHRQTTQRLAIDQGDILDLRTLEDLAAERRRLKTVLAACPPDRRTDIRSLTTRHTELHTDLEPLTARYNQLADQRLKRRATRDEMSALQRRINHASLSIARVEAELATAALEQTSRDRFVLAHAPDQHHLDDLTVTIDARIAARVDGYRADPPEHLVSRLGEPPVDRSRLDSWTKAARIIETHRLENGITDPHHAFGTAVGGRPAGDPHQFRFELTLADQAMHISRPPKLGPGLSR